MTSTHKNSKALRFIAIAVMAVVMGLFFAAPSGAVSSGEGCYPSCTTTTEQLTTTTAEQESTTTEVVATTTEVVTTTTAGVEASHEDSGGGSLPVTGGDIIGIALAGLAAVAMGAALIATSRTRQIVEPN